MMPKVSIIVPVYNAERYLRECLDSVVAQSFVDWECILVDDGSKDNSPAICDEYAAKDKRFRVIHQQNAGPSKARNAGLDVAQGEWISFIDADDWVDEGYFDSLLNCTDKVDIISFGMTIRKESGDSVTLRLAEKYYNAKESVNDAVYRLKSPGGGYDFVGIPWNKFLKSSIIKENNIRFPEDIVFYEDQVFALRFLQNANSVLISNESPYNYRILQTSLTRGYKRTSFEYSRISEYYIQETRFLANTSAEPFYQRDIVNFYFDAISVSSFKDAIKYCGVLHKFMKEVPTSVFSLFGIRRRFFAAILRAPYLGLLVVAIFRHHC